MRSNRKSSAASKTVQGFTLVEVLIALIILSVGMLGIAGLYVHSMAAGRTSLFRHHAVTIVGDIADRIRANPKAAGAYAVAGGADNNCVDGGINCTPAAMAANDIFLWGIQTADVLPAGNVTVVFNNAPVPPTYQITVRWSEPGRDQAMTYSITIPVFPI